MHAPLYSSITLFAELIISAVIYFTLYSGYKNNKFPTIPAAAALIYELIFNITYMAGRVPSHVKVAKIEKPSIVILAIVHGVLSLIMFIALIVFFIVAWKNYKKGVNYFREHKTQTMIFIFFWTFSIVTGVLFYLVEYVF
ncbi:MAG TPA: hypothetical protein VG965_04560 [Patescibacteria group bacterium]|nr:hypothetical protein [Patescibacteria group bacterium]